MTKIIKIATCNFQENGKGDPAVWQCMHEMLADYEIDLLFRQELLGCAPHGRESRLWKRSQEILGMQGQLGPGRHATAVYWNPTVFEKVETWATDWPGWFLHPTAVTLRLRDAQDIETVAASAHLAFHSPTKRRAQAEDLTYLADRVVDPSDPQRRKMPVFLGTDQNSYADPEGAVAGEVPIPTPGQLRGDPQHLAHRSVSGTGERIMDSEPSRILETADLIDAARVAHAQIADPGKVSPVGPTMRASTTHGPETRVDFVRISKVFRPAVVDGYVMPIADELSDHNVVIIEMDMDALVDVYRAYHS